RLIGRAESGAGDGLHQRDARAVEVHEARLGRLERALVDELADVLLEVEPLNADRARRPVDVDLERAILGERLLVLADLEVLRHVRVVVVLPGEPARLVDAAVEGESGSHRKWPAQGPVWLRNSALTVGGLPEVRCGGVRPRS